MVRLTFYERQQIEFWFKGKVRIRNIAKLLNRDHFVISREVKRNRSQLFPYNALIAQKAAERRAKKTNKRKLDRDSLLRGYVQEQLVAGWSPEQIVGRLKYLPPAWLKDRKLCHETIYQYIYGDGRAKDGSYLYCCLRKAKSQRQPYRYRTKRKSPIPYRVSIGQRPLIVNTKDRYGDWEADTMVFKRGQAGVGVVYERKAKYVGLTKLNDLTACTTVEAITAKLEGLPAFLRQTMTFDNGPENTKHQTLKENLELSTYFTDPYKAWHKGGVENVIGLVRQYIPKGTPADKVSDEQVQKIQDLLNHRPRKRLQYATPYEIIQLQINQNGALNSRI